MIGVWTTASRQRVRVGRDGYDADRFGAGPWSQVSRLGNPLVNELIIGIGDKDRWNHLPPITDGQQFLEYFATPLLATLLPSLYPGVFPNLAAYNAGKANTRPDLEAILLTGIPAGLIKGFTNYNGTGVKADQLRLNTAIPPSARPNSLGLLAATPDLAGFPNGRRVFDDVATIELRAVAGATLPLVVPTFKADGAAGVVDFGLTKPADGRDLDAKGTENYLHGLPVPRRSLQRLLQPVQDPEVGRAVTGRWNISPHRVGRARSSSTSAATSEPPSSTPRRRSTGQRSRSA